MTQTELAFVALAWLGTYLVHSTLLLGGVWLLTKRVFRAPRIGERMWRLAMVGGVITASLQVGLGQVPVLGHLELAASGDDQARSTPEAPARSDALEETRVRAPEHLGDDSVSEPQLSAAITGVDPFSRSERDRLDLTPPQAPARASSARSGFFFSDEDAVFGEIDATEKNSDLADFFDAPAPGRLTEPARLANDEPETLPSVSRREPESAGIASIASGGEAPFGPRGFATGDATERTSAIAFAQRALPWKSVVVGAWVLIGGLGILAFFWAWSQLVRRLSDRREIIAGPLREKLDELCECAGARGRVRLFASAKLLAPISHGWFRPKISIPLRAITDLSPAQQASMLGHELAHAQRRDPSWFSLYTLFERVLFFQPLNRLARRELHEIAELLCDDWAVRWMGGGRLALASCLTEIAQWIVGRRQLALPSPGMAGGSRLGVRVERLLDDRKSPQPEPRHRWWSPAALSSLGIIVFAAPGVSSTPAIRSAELEPTAEAPAALGAAEASTTVKLPTPVRALRLDEEFLDAELEILEDEVRSIRAALGGANSARFQPTLARIEEQIRTLRESRERLRTLLTLLLNTSTPAHETAATNRKEPLR